MKEIIAARKISKGAFLRNDAWNVRCDASHVEIGYVAPLQYKNNIFWIFKTAISRNCEKWMATCGMSDTNIQKRFAIKIRKLKENPDIHGKSLKGSLHGYWELYFENKFRILYTIDYNEKVVIIEAIKHKNEF